MVLLTTELIALNACCIKYDYLLTLLNSSMCYLHKNPLPNNLKKVSHLKAVTINV